MKLIILTTTMLLSILAGSLSVTIVSWATSQPLAARSYMQGSSACGSHLMWVDDASGESWPATAASVEQLADFSSAGMSIRSNAVWSCAAAGTVSASSSAFAELEPGQ